jgi:hypothetical protein
MHMAKRRYGWDEKKIARYLKEGRGQGQLESYQPWLTIHDLSSLGRSTRVHSFKTGRDHHLLSDLETDLFFLLEWDQTVVDIREQFPLDREETRRLAREAGVAHPQDPSTQTDIVMTSDVLVDLHTSDGVGQVVCAVKLAIDLDDQRVIEKLELERRYWRAQGTPWYLVTDRDLPAERVKNIRWLHEMYSLDYQIIPHPAYWDDRCERFVEQLHRVHGGLIRDFFGHLETTCGFASGDALTVLRHLAARRVVLIDLDRSFSTNDTLAHLTLSEAVIQTARRVA